jgi:hypothetical protein
MSMIWGVCPPFYLINCLQKFGLGVLKEISLLLPNSYRAYTILMLIICLEIFTDSTEWKLKKEIFDRICNHFFVPDIDLFASHLNCQIPSFFIIIFPNKLKGGKIYGLKLAHGIVNASTKDA